MLRYFPFVATFFLLACAFASVAPAQEKSSEPLSLDAIRALSELELAVEGRGAEPPTEPSGEWAEWTILPSPGISSDLSTKRVESLPFTVPNTMMLQVDPDITDEELQQLFIDYDMRPTNVYKNLGVVEVQTDLSEFFSPQLGDNSTNDALLRGMVESAAAFKEDSRIIAATPETFLGTQEVNSFAAVSIDQIEKQEGLFPQPIALFEFNESGEEYTDWGVLDIEADDLWKELEASDGVILGVMDVGFSRHLDLAYLGLRREEVAADHGNHVAAIACAKHQGFGIKGVLPNCLVRPRSGDVYPIADEGGNILTFLTRFSQIIRDLDDFVGANSEVKAFNVSLGYNWISNFGINPDLPDNGLYRQLVASQGEFIIGALEKVEDRGAFIVSAAGNDSTRLAAPMRAKFASPFNWAADEARRRGVAGNGLVVEAHDSSGKRASFSNVGGDVSCPGVNVRSAVAFDALGAPSDKLFGEMSGTSMASPYCAAGLVLLSLVRPNYSAEEIIGCVKDGGRPSDSDTPMMRLRSAMSKCPPK